MTQQPAMVPEGAVTWLVPECCGTFPFLKSYAPGHLRLPAIASGSRGSSYAGGIVDAKSSRTTKAQFGVPGLDDILSGGLIRNRQYLFEGTPGSGKTTLALQFLLEGAGQGEKGLYITL